MTALLLSTTSYALVLAAVLTVLVVAHHLFSRPVPATADESRFLDISSELFAMAYASLDMTTYAMADGADAPVGATDGPTDDDTVTFPPFSARDLPNVLDRVQLPVSIELPDGTVLVDVDGAHSRPWFQSFIEVTMANGSDASLDAGAMVEFSGPVTMLDAPDGVIAYVGDGGLLCADHGAPLDIGTEDGFVSPIFDGSDLDSVEWCGHGHSFCGSCGTTMETTHGAHDREVEGQFANCANCGTSSVYVDGDGFHYVYSFGDTLDSHNVDVSGPFVQYVTDVGDSIRVTAVDADNAPYQMRSLRFYLAWVELNPSAGRVLILCESEDEAFETADEWAESTVDLDEYPADEHDGVLSDVRADVRIARIAPDQITITTKR